MCRSLLPSHPNLCSLFPWTEGATPLKCVWASGTIFLLSLRPPSQSLSPIDFASRTSLKVVYFLSVLPRSLYQPVILCHCSTLPDTRLRSCICLLNEWISWVKTIPDDGRQTARPQDWVSKDSQRCKVQEIFWRTVLEAQQSGFGLATALDVIWLSGKASPSRPLDVAREVIFSDYSCLKNWSQGMFTSLGYVNARVRWGRVCFIPSDKRGQSDCGL